MLDSLELASLTPTPTPTPTPAPPFYAISVISRRILVELMVLVPLTKSRLYCHRASKVELLPATFQSERLAKRAHQ
eukprot:6376758-Pyramimonas_sp.AAC.1